MAEWEGIADADAHLGRDFPLPAVPLPLARWVEVLPLGAGAEVAWNLDDTRRGAPARLTLYAGPEPAPERELSGAGPPEAVAVGAVAATLRTAPLAEAEPSLRPVTELTWQAGGLCLRLTAQGPWTGFRLMEIAASITP